ncbi:EF-hand domain-containing family member B isoform X2 [Octopus bimaculoides]|uniref:EFHB C-terminal EF-hand domain-containing protein n=1 Tax=Octopus bimaculoides TaxID=37653 RepID=A0A0L8HLC2_OCTBM|nr:EF-hand domain-containing family member B isoform X2 [Octopus bimaculoides]|eukprot:XP_014771360.1 PREDICTED: EF-hand domain-containing family member B-like isoform X2 [Octopus bimaculoides]
MCEKLDNPLIQPSRLDEGSICINSEQSKDNCPCSSLNYVGREIEDCKNVTVDTPKKTTRRKSKKRKDLVGECLQYPAQPPTPCFLKKFQDYYKTDVGLRRRHYGISYDPERYFTEKMWHCKVVKNPYPLEELISPHMKTQFQEICDNFKENLYMSKKHASVGKKSQWHIYAPEDVEQLRHGKTVEPDGDVGKVVNPPYSQAELREQDDKYHHLYVASHKDLYPGEHVQRGYKPPFKPSATFGDDVVKHSDGALTKASMKWVDMARKEKATPLISYDFEEFNRKTHPRVGTTLNQIRDGRKFPYDHIFGRHIIATDTVGTVIHDGTPFQYGDMKDHFGFLVALRKHLSETEYSRLTKVLIAMQQADAEKTGYLSTDEAMRIMLEQEFPINVEGLRAFLEMWNDENGGVNYHLLINSLNWKSPLPCSHMLPLDRLSQLGEKQEESLKSKVKEDKTKFRFQKSSSTINSVFDANGVTKNWRCYGIPNFRADLIPPKIQNLSNPRNYANQSDAFNLIRPSVYAEYGMDLEMMKPRTLDELKDIYGRSGLPTDEETFLKMHCIATNGKPDEKVSLHSIQKLFQRSGAPARLIK